MGTPQQRRESAISQPFLRGMSIIESVGSHPATVSELARKLDLDKAVVSRLVTSAETDGWLVKRNGIVVLGPRAAALGRESAERSFERVAAELCHTVAGVTGLDAAANQFAGQRGYVLAHSPGRRPLMLGDVEFQEESLILSAVGLSVGVQFDAAEFEELRARLERAHPGDSRFTKVSVDARMEPIRGGAAARESGDFVEGLGCVAVPWRHPLAVAPTALSVIGPVDAVDAASELLERVVVAAVQPGANSSSVIAAAAAAA